MGTNDLEASHAQMPSKEEGEIEEGEIQASQNAEPHLSLTSERGLTSDPSERRPSTSPASSRPASSQLRKMSGRHRTGRDRRESYRERDHFSRSYSSSTSSSYRTERACLHERQCLVQEILALTKRATPQDTPKALDGVCRELKVAARKLERLRRLVSKSRSDPSDVTECAHRVFTGLRSVHITCTSRSGALTKVDGVKDVMRFALQYRHILFGLSQKRDLEDWIREAETTYLRPSEHREASRERSISHYSVPKPPEPSAFEVEEPSRSQSAENRLRNEGAQVPRGETDGSMVPARESTERPRSSPQEGIGHGVGSESATPSAFLRSPCKTPDSKRGRWVEVENPAARVRPVHDAEAQVRAVPDETTKPETCYQTATDDDHHESKNLHSRQPETPSRDVAKKQRQGDDSGTPRTPSEMDLSMEKPDTNPQRERERDTSMTEERLQEKTNPVDNLTNPSIAEEPPVPVEPENSDLAEPRGLNQADTQSTSRQTRDMHGRSCVYLRGTSSEGLEQGSQPESRSLHDTPEQTPRGCQQSPFGLKSVRYTATEANDLDIRSDDCLQCSSERPVSHSHLMDLSIPPPPPPLIFKPKPISPDVAFDPQPDAYWESLLYDVPLLKGHCRPEGVCTPLLEGKLCLVLDLDTVLFSTTHFSELDAESEQLLHSCLDNETHLPFFARSLHCIPRLSLWVKLRPGLNKFLRIVKSAFWIYGHTHRSKEEMDRLLKLFDPDGWIPTHRIFYDTIAPGESIYKKVHRLRPALHELRPVTVVLSDACLKWEDMDAVLGTESYLFFPESKAKLGLTSPSMFETKTDEEDCGFLLNALDILLQLRQRTLETVSDPRSSSLHQKYSQSRLPKHILQLKPWDARRIMAETRMGILSDVSIYFDRVLTPKEPHDQQILWRMATSMGALCSLTHTERTTHVITLTGSPKISWARSRGYFVVSPVWLEASFVLWFRLSESLYSVHS